MDLLVPARLLWLLNMHYGADSSFSDSHTSGSACSNTQEDTPSLLSHSATQLSGDTNVPQLYFSQLLEIIVALRFQLCLKSVMYVLTCWEMSTAVVRCNYCVNESTVCLIKKN